MDEIFRALSDPTRRGIVRLLREGSRTAGQLAEAFPLAKSTLSAHFASLRRAGLIVAARRGTTIDYALNTAALHDVMAEIASWVDRPDPIRAGQVARRVALAPLAGVPHVEAERLTQRLPERAAPGAARATKSLTPQGAN